MEKMGDNDRVEVDKAECVLWSRLKDNTTAHGVHHMNHAKGGVKTSFWGLLTAAAISLFVFMLWGLVDKYLSYNVDIVYKMVYVREQTFPAVTICNMNPVKVSSLKAASGLVNLTYNIDQNESSRKRRSSGTDCSNSSFIHPQSGVCFHILSNSITEFDGSGNIKETCESTVGGAAMPNTQSKMNFVADIVEGVFGADSSTSYYLYITNSKWGKQVAVSDFEQYASGSPSADANLGCIAAYVNNSHLWQSVSCQSSQHIGVCQQLVQCPYPVYHDNTDNTDTCYFLFDGWTQGRQSQAKSLCETVDSVQSTTLAVLDTAEKVQHIVDSGILTAATVDSYWLNLAISPPSTWRWNDADAINYTNWASSPATIGGLCGKAEISNNHSWVDVSCSDQALALCQWTASSIDYVPSPTVTTAAADVTTAAADVTTAAAPTTMANDGTTTSAVGLNTTASDVSTAAASTTMTNDGTTTSAVGLITTASDVTTAAAGLTTADTDTTPDITITTAAVRTTTPPTSDIPVPPTVPGSIYPERILTNPEFQAEEKLIETLADLPESTKSSLGFQANEFLLDCQFSGMLCDPEADFRQFYNGIHGNCFTFNKYSNESLVKISTNPGRRYGLQVTININQAEYLTVAGDDAGARVTVHAQDAMPFPEDEGIVVRPGRLSSIGISKMEVQRLGGNYGDCVPSGEVNITRSIYEELYSVNYTVAGCQKTCFQHYVIDECSCADASVPTYGAAFQYKNISVCDSSNITQDDCRYGVTQLYLSNELECDCPQACRTMNFFAKTSTMLWPSDVHDPIVRQRFGIDENETNQYRNNYLKVEVYFSSFTEKQISQTPHYRIWNLIPDMGGILGLCLGFSWLTIFEFLEFFCEFLILGARKYSRRCRSTSRDVSDAETISTSRSISTTISLYDDGSVMSTNINPEASAKRIPTPSSPSRSRLTSHTISNSLSSESSSLTRVESDC